MAKQRKSLLANLDMEVGKDDIKAAEPIVEIMPNKVGNKVSKTTKTSLYLPPKAHHKLKEIALSKDCKVHDLVIQGIDKVLAENGFPSVKEFIEL